MHPEDKVAWKHYLLYAKPGPDHIGDPFACDIILAFSFGRNTYIDAQLPRISKLHCLMKGDAATLRALKKEGVDIGQPNQKLAGKLKDIIETSHISSFAQWEVLLGLEWSWYLKKSQYISGIWPDKHVKDAFTTMMGARQMIPLLRDGGLSAPLILAHRDHLARAYLIVRKLMGKRARIAAMAGTAAYDPASVQPQTRDWESWIRSERLVRVHHIIHRYVL
ncbi:MAG: hypothetical protein Q8R40_03785 [bacterium]|nr:hypothetical protein [bacterium]